MFALKFQHYTAEIYHQLILSSDPQETDVDKDKCCLSWDPSDTEMNHVEPVNNTLSWFLSDCLMACLYGSWKTLFIVQKI